MVSFCLHTAVLMFLSLTSSSLFCPVEGQRRGVELPTPSQQFSSPGLTNDYYNIDDYRYDQRQLLQTHHYQHSHHRHLVPLSCDNANEFPVYFKFAFTGPIQIQWSITPNNTVAGSVSTTPASSFTSNEDLVCLPVGTEYELTFDTSSGPQVTLEENLVEFTFIIGEVEQPSSSSSKKSSNSRRQLKKKKGKTPSFSSSSSDDDDDGMVGSGFVSITSFVGDAGGTTTAPRASFTFTSSAITSGELVDANNNNVLEVSNAPTSAPSVSLQPTAESEQSDSSKSSKSKKSKRRHRGRRL